jgi:XTP/dITP diphosphohydrolase
MVLVMIQFLFQKKKKTFGEMKPSKKYKIDHRFKAFKKIKKFL